MSTNSVTEPSARSLNLYRLLCALFLLAATAFRSWYSGQVELVQDEAYYWQWSRHLALGYYDNTPLMAYVIHFFTLPQMLGSTEVGVRAGAVISSIVVSIFVYLLAKQLLDEKAALVSVVVANLIPLYSAGAILMTQDPVHVALWSITLYITWIALQQSRPFRTWFWWILAGVLAGLTAMAKLNGILILPGIFLYVCLVPKARRWLKHSAPYLAVVLAFLVVLPFLYWNHTHENAFWIHIHTMGERGADKAKTLRWTGEFLGAQAVLLSPLIFLTYLYTLRLPKAGDEPSIELRPLLYLWSASAVVFSVTVLETFRSRVEGNWAVSSYVSGIILVGWLVSRSTVKARIWHCAAIALAILMTAVVYFPSIGYAMGLRLKTDRTTDLHGWREMAKRVEIEQRSVGGPTNSFVFGVNYRMPSEMAFYLPGHPTTYSLFLHDRRNEYMFWDNPNKQIGKNAIFVNDSGSPDHLSDCQAVFARVVVEPALQLYRAPYNKPIRTIQIFRCYDFKGYKPAQWEQGW
jgi:hypothetical protein